MRLVRCRVNLPVLLLWSMTSGAAMAHDHIIERSWLEDSTSQLTWSEVQNRPTQPFTGVLSQGYGQGVIWIRLRIDPQPTSAHIEWDNRLILRIRPVCLDEIQVFDPLEPKGLAGVTGDRHHPRLDEYQGLDLLLPITRGTQARDIWLRLDTSSSRQLDVRALNLDDLNHQALLHAMICSIYLALLALLAIWGIVNWLFNREALIGFFGFQQLAILMYALSSLGYTRAIWPASWSAESLDHSTSVMIFTASFAMALFHKHLISLFTPPVWISRLHLCMLAMLFVKLSILWSSPLMALRLQALENMIFPLIFLMSALLCSAWDKSDSAQPLHSRRLVVGFYGFAVLLMALLSIPNLGIQHDSHYVGHYISQISNIITTLLLLFMVLYRDRLIRRQQKNFEMELARSQLLAQNESQLREEQEKLLTMLAHELKTPLATMHMRMDSKASESQEIRKALRDMNDVIDRCQQALLLGDQKLQPQEIPVDMIQVAGEVAASCAYPDRIELNIPEQLILHTDPQLWFIVMNNLVENACKYAAAESVIEIKLNSFSSQDGSIMQVEFTNIPGDAGWPDAEKLFEKYYRAPSARRQAGTGLGLYLVRKLMDILGGKIEYAPTDQKVRFVLTFPYQPTPLT